MRLALALPFLLSTWVTSAPITPRNIAIEPAALSERRDLAPADRGQRQKRGIFETVDQTVVQPVLSFVGATSSTIIAWTETGVPADPATELQSMQTNLASSSAIVESGGLLIGLLSSTQQQDLFEPVAAGLAQIQDGFSTLSFPEEFEGATADAVAAAMALGQQISDYVEYKK